MNYPYKDKITKTDVIKYLGKRLISEKTDKRKKDKDTKARIALLKDLMWYFDENFV